MAMLVIARAYQNGLVNLDPSRVAPICAGENGMYSVSPVIGMEENKQSY